MCKSYLGADSWQGTVKGGGGCYYSPLVTAMVYSYISDSDFCLTNLILQIGSHVIVM